MATRNTRSNDSTSTNAENSDSANAAERDEANTNENNELVNVADSSTDGEASTTSMNVENTVNTHTATTYQPYTW